MDIFGGTDGRDSGKGVIRTGAAALAVLLAIIATSAAWVVFGRDEVEQPVPTLAAVATGLRTCSSAAETIAKCDHIAATGVVALTSRASTTARVAGHRQRYLTTLAEHYSRNCSGDQTDTRALCRTDYLDLSVMISAALPVQAE
ncbi:hypothetical protein [Gordonia malaquae]|uniref:hypothetical protein n=1 Tax=Gordonia malaquae TaxID=410332 RepID=UPI00301870DF